MKRLRPIHYYDQLLGENFLFFLGTDPDETEKFLAKTWKFTGPLFNDRAGVALEFRAPPNRNAIVVWTRVMPKSAKDLGTLAHECVHAAHMALSFHGVRPDFENDEVLCHLVGCLVRQAMVKK